LGQFNASSARASCARQEREIALRFLDKCEDFWMPPIDEEYLMPFTDSILYDDSDDFDSRL